MLRCKPMTAWASLRVHGRSGGVTIERAIVLCILVGLAIVVLVFLARLLGVA